MKSLWSRKLIICCWLLCRKMSSSAFGVGIMQFHHYCLTPWTTFFWLPLVIPLLPPPSCKKSFRNHDIQNGAGFKHRISPKLPHLFTACKQKTVTFQINVFVGMPLGAETPINSGRIINLNPEMFRLILGRIINLVLLIFSAVFWFWQNCSCLCHISGGFNF